MNFEIKRTAIKSAPSPQCDDALQAYLQADYRQALERVRSAPSMPTRAEDRILEARILMRLGDAGGALAAARAAGAVANSVDESTLSAALQGAALDRLAKFDEAAQVFRVAREVGRTAHRTVRAELGHFQAIAAWAAGDVARAERLVESALLDADDVVAALLLQLRGWIETRRERYAAAAERFDAALRASRRSRYRDLHLEARLIHALAVIATETIDLPLAERVDAHDDEFPWNDELARERFNTTTCRRYAAMLRGDMEEAYRLGERAIAQAPSASFAAIAHTNHAELLHFVGDAFAAGYHFKAARARISATQWSNADVEEHIALANYAIEAASLDPAGSSQCLVIYRSVSALKRRELVFDRDRRVQAYREFAEGRVAEALGDAERARTSYDRSLRCWVALGYRMRAAIVSTHLARLTKSDAVPIELKNALSLAPRAWFGAQLPERAGVEDVPRLTRAQRRVLGHLLAGKASKEIANALRRSDYTIRNQTKCIFRAFNVRSRAALIVRCQREGITAEAEACSA